MRSMVRWTARTVVAVGVAAGGLVAAGGPASAAPTPAPAHAEPDYCTLSPDVGYVPVYYDFGPSCARHDWCYEAKPYEGVSADPRKQCDDDFRTSMKAWCNGYYSRWWQAPARSACRGTADVYYNAVRAFGGVYY